MASTPHTPASLSRNQDTSRDTNDSDSVPTASSNVFSTPALRVKGSPAPAKLFPFARAASTPPEITNESKLRSSTRTTSRGLSSIADLEQSWSRPRLSKKRSQYYDEVFAYREPQNTVKDRVMRDSLVMAEVKLNCILESEQTFLGDLSFQLSEIYQRPETCIMVSVLPEAPILLAGNAEPAYYLTITALRSEIGAALNKRSTSLIQSFMSESLQIAANRGVIRFEALTEENLATNGMTTLQEIENLERKSNDEDGVIRTISKTRSKKGKKSPMPIFTERGKMPVPPSQLRTPPEMNDKADSKSTNGAGPEKKRMRRRRSIMAFFGRYSQRSE